MRMARVTVINDSSEFLDLMRDLLVDLGHEMTGLQAVETSIDEVVSSHPDLLIVDLRLEDKPQEISGWELVVLARAHRQLLSVPLILCSADVLELKKRARDLEQIAGVYVRTKPFEVDDMSELITRLTDGRAGTSPPG
jgi:CheY-like chemotaxis protein